MFLLRRNENFGNNRPAYVAHSGYKHSYTCKPEYAKRFSSIEDASDNACDNEYPAFVTFYVG